MPLTRCGQCIEAHVCAPVISACLWIKNLSTGGPYKGDEHEALPYLLHAEVSMFVTSWGRGGEATFLIQHGISC